MNTVVRSQENSISRAGGVQNATALTSTSNTTSRVKQLPPELQQGVERNQRFSMRMMPTQKEQARTVVVDFAEKFAELAENKKEFSGLLKKVFGGGDYDANKAEDYRQRAIAGDFSWMPPVRFVDDAILGGAYGAYSSEKDVVYLNKNLLADPALASKVYSEELGHFLDSQLKTTDSQGEEGELFRRLFSGENLSDKDISTIRAKSGKGTITLDGQQVAVEFLNIFKGVTNAISNFTEPVTNAISNFTEPVTNAVSKFTKPVTSAVSRAFGWAGKKSSKLLGSTLRVFDKVMPSKAGDKWYNKIYNSMRVLARSPIETLGSLVNSSMRTFQSLADGDIKGAWGWLKKGAKDAIGKPLGAASNAIYGLFSIFFGEKHTGVRGLNADERASMRKIFGDGVDLDAVKLAFGPDNDERSHAHRDTLIIHISASDGGPGQPVPPKVLAHEMAHIWQFQNGSGNFFEDSTVNKWWKKNIEGRDDDVVYEWSRYYNKGVEFSELNMEAQAELLDDIAMVAPELDSGRIVRLQPRRFGWETLTALPPGQETPADIALTAYLRRALADARAGRNAP